jgi:ribosomal protein S18 acetylase RimI-like enzyme
MIAIKDRKNVYDIIASIKKGSNDFITNFYPDDEKLNYWIDKQIFFFKYFANTVFFFRKDRDFYHLYFCSKNLINLSVDLKIINNQFSEIFVSDCIGTEPLVEKLVAIFEECGFKKYVKYNRMKKFIYFNDLLPPVNQEVSFARLEDSLIIFDLFESNFDRFAEQLPTIEELEISITKNEVFILKDNSNIAGVLIRKMTSKSSLLMFFLVKIEYRNKKVGSKLLSYYFNECKNKRIIMWVLSNNKNAIDIYKHYGFSFDILNDQIMINNNMHYEAKNN